ncbi:MAG: PASTA domain-containing protein [Bacteroidales bacterium]|nr:PASTA domain-containing protein [Bacteroidales bacterium]
MDIKKHKVLFINIGCIIAVVIAVFVGFSFWVESYTSHGEDVIVPDFVNMDVEAAEIIAQKNELVLKVSDTLISEKIAPGAIVDYFPSAGSKVKRGRTIYLSVNSMTPIMVKMPKVTEGSLRQAIQLLENRGLRVGNIEYKPDFADNYVFEQRYQSRVIEPGTKISKGSAIDLLVGKGGNDVQIPIPSLIGMSWTLVSDSLVARGLSVNAIFADNVKSLSDTLRARVQRQSPAYSEGQTMQASQTMDVWFGIDPIYEAISNDLN